MGMLKREDMEAAVELAQELLFADPRPHYTSVMVDIKDNLNVTLVTAVDITDEAVRRGEKS